MKNRDAIQDEMISFYNSDIDYFNKLSHRKISEYRAILAILNIVGKNKKIFDVGCGTGNLLSFLHGKGFRDLEGIDMCQAFIKHAKRHTEIKFHDDDILKFNKKGYDCILATDILEHTVYPSKVIDKMVLMLNDNGLMIIQGPNMLQLLSQKSTMNLDVITLFLKKWVLSIFNQSRLDFRKPMLTKDTHRIDDADACYLINPFDIEYMLKKNNMNIIYLSTFYNPMGRFSKFKKGIVLLLSHLPVLKYFGGTLFVIAVKNHKDDKLRRRIRRIMSGLF